MEEQATHGSSDHLCCQKKGNKEKKGKGRSHPTKKTCHTGSLSGEYVPRESRRALYAQQLALLREEILECRGPHALSTGNEAADALIGEWAPELTEGV